MLKIKPMAVSLNFSIGMHEGQGSYAGAQTTKTTRELLRSWRGWVVDEGGGFKLHDHCWNSEMMKQKLTFYIYRMEEEENEGVITIINIIIRGTNIQASLTRKPMLKGDKIWVSLYQTKSNRNLSFNNMVICFL